MLPILGGLRLRDRAACLSCLCTCGFERKGEGASPKGGPVGFPRNLGTFLGDFFAGREFGVAPTMAVGAPGSLAVKRALEHGALARGVAAARARLRHRSFGCASCSVPRCCPCPWSRRSVCRPCSCCCRRPQWRCGACSARRWARSGAAPPGAAALLSVWCGVWRVCAAGVVCRVYS